MSCELSSWRRQCSAQIPLYISVSRGCSCCREPAPETVSWEARTVTSWSTGTPKGRRVVWVAVLLPFCFLYALGPDPALALWPPVLPSAPAIQTPPLGAQLVCAGAGELWWEGRHGERVLRVLHSGSPGWARTPKVAFALDSLVAVLLMSTLSACPQLDGGPARSPVSASHPITWGTDRASRKGWRGRTSIPAGEGQPLAFRSPFVSCASPSSPGTSTPQIPSFRLMSHRRLSHTFPRALSW